MKIPGLGFEMPAIFSRLGPRNNPPLAAPLDTRHVADVLAQPIKRFYDPNSLNFAPTRPLVPGAGGYVSMGLGPVVYDHQAQWDRGAVAQAGPVRKFFRGLMYDNRVKHV